MISAHYSRYFSMSRLVSAVTRLVLNRGGYGLEALDIDVINIINPSGKGFFIELGANDGVRQSNTFLLQKKYKWQGVLIEPNPARFEECIRNRQTSPEIRTYCCACVPFSYNQPYVEMINCDLMSIAKGLDATKEEAEAHALTGSEFLSNSALRYIYFAKAQTLTEVLDDAKPSMPVDFLSLDVEGNEMSVLQGLDFAKYAPAWILVETRDRSVIDFLLNQHYEIAKSFDATTRKDILFQRKALPR